MSEGGESVNAWCSWCHTRGAHALVERNLLRRNVYRCTECGRRTVICRWCQNMARGGQPAADQGASDQHTADAGSTDEGLGAWLDARWDDECCAEHNGTVRDFEKLEARLEDLADFGILLERKGRNMKRVSKTVLIGTGSGLVAAPLALIMAPAAAGAAGATGVLGAAGTGTGISTLSGIALTNASLAAIGGSVVGGTVVLTAAGAALGGVGGGIVFGAYADEVEGFDIRLYRGGSGPAVVYIDGFLTEDGDTSREWLDGSAGVFGGPRYHLRWESKRLRQIGGFFAGATAKEQVIKGAARLARRGTKKGGGAFALVRGAVGAVGLLKNPWHVAQVKAAMTGAMLADLLARTDHPDGFVLVGHSLGARVIRFALAALATRDEAPIVRDVHLLGGAVCNSQEAWDGAAGAVSGRIFNYHSSNDLVLRFLYSTANFFTSSPVGREPIQDVDAVTNIDVSDIIDGHTAYRRRLAAVLSRAEARRERTAGPVLV